MVMQIPSNMLITRLRPSLYLPCWVLIWSIVSACTGAVQNYGQLVAVRVLLGVSEAPFFPGVYFLMASWYTRRELGLRMAFLYSGLILATAFSGLIAAGVFAGLSGSLGLSGWRVSTLSSHFQCEINLADSIYSGCILSRVP
jgi:MFS family permease